MRHILNSVFAATFAACTPVGIAMAAENYVVMFEGAPNGLEESFRKISNLSTERRPYPTSAAIRRIAREDESRVREALQAAGYFAGDVKFNLHENNDGAKLRAVFVISAGPKYEIAEHVIRYEDESVDDRPTSYEEANVKITSRADGATLQKNQQAFLAALWGSGYPGALITARRVEIRTEDSYARAIYTFKSGPKSHFGEIVFTGNERTENDFLEKLKTWEIAETFDRAKLIAYRDRLGATGLFTSVDVEPGAPDDDGAAPVLVTLEERKRRTVGAGLSYSTTEGPGGRLFLEYRNMFRRGERTRIDLSASGIEQSIRLDVNKPLPAFPGDVYGNFAFLNETTDAFKARSVELSGGFSKRFLDDRLEMRAGLAFETSGLEAASTTLSPQADDRTYFSSAPISATWNTEDDPLFLTRGVRASVRIIPYIGSDEFIRLESDVRSRVNFGKGGRFTLAGRTRLDATIGSSLFALPVNKRVYAGGGASIRGYGYQAAGPLDAEGVPLGGRSVIEGAVEGRAKVTKHLQFAGFVDAGLISPDSFPSFKQNLFVGAGGGVRYLTPIGPIRVDLALPLEKRATDDDFQIYISLGQPF